MKTKKKRTWLKVILLVFVILCFSAGGYAYYVYQSLSKTVDTMYQPVVREKSEKRVEQITLEEQEPFSVLLLGVDEREGDKGRSDTMIVLTVNPNNQSIKMLSIPRDTRTEIIGRGFEDKINHAYAFGNEEMSMATVENFLDIPLDYFIKVNMKGFEDIVNAVGGIEVNSRIAFSLGDHHFKQGINTLNGDQALSYVRMRKEDPNGDFGRQERQRQVIQGVIKKGISFSSLTNFNSIFQALGKNIRTNMTFSEMKDIQKNYKTAAKRFEQIELSGEDVLMDGIYYFIVQEEEKLHVQEVLKLQLEM